jgi:glycosyltransferase involved in cell wall biosynthesis
LTIRRESYVTDRYGGYEVFSARSAPKIVQRVVAAFKPDVAVVQGRLTVPLVEHLQACNVPAVVYIRDVDFAEQLDSHRFGELTRFVVANSQFTADTVRARFGIDARVIVPTVVRSDYEVQSSREVVLFTNPVAKKGVALALEVARLCPDIPFVFVESWTLSSAQVSQLQAQLQSLPNVRFVRRTADMRELYRIARIVLMPSVWEEAWGRVASEAHVSGIPVIGSNKGGLPEAIGPGGVVLDTAEPAAKWSQALRDLWSDPQRYLDYSNAARAFSMRDELDLDKQVESLAGILGNAIETARSGPRRG